MPRGEAVLWVFAPDAASTVRIATAVRRETVAIGVEPVNVRVDEWRPEEMVWSDDRTAGTGLGTGAPSDVVNAVMDIIRGLFIWP